jgi:hypothetical protein
MASRFLQALLLVAFCLCLLAGGSLAQTCDSGKGYCIDTNAESCSSGTLIHGLCPGASNIVCCEYPTCDSSRGQCIDTNKMTCSDGVLKTGYCPGASNIMCCSQSTVDCSSGGSLIEGSYEFTLKNQGMSCVVLCNGRVTLCCWSGFTGHPGALVYVPTTFSKSSETIVSIGFQKPFQCLFYL